MFTGHILPKPTRRIPSSKPSTASAARIACSGGAAPPLEPRSKPLGHVVTFLSSFLASAHVRRSPTVFPVGPAAIHERCGKNRDARHSVHPECLSSFRRQKTPHVPVKPLLTAAPFLPESLSLSDSSLRPNVTLDD